MIDLHCESLIDILEKNIYWSLLSYISIFTKCTDNTFPHKPWSHGALHLPNLTFLFIPIQNIPTHWFLYSTIRCNVPFLHCSVFLSLLLLFHCYLNHQQLFLFLFTSTSFAPLIYPAGIFMLFLFSVSFMNKKERITVSVVNSDDNDIKSTLLLMYYFSASFSYLM